MVAHQGKGTQGEAVVYPGIKPEGEGVRIVVVRVVPVCNQNDNRLVQKLLRYPPNNEMLHNSLIDFKAD